jgi:hypothetical protein
MNFSSLYKNKLLKMIIYKINYLAYGKEISPFYLFIILFKFIKKIKIDIGYFK